MELIGHLLIIRVGMACRDEAVLDASETFMQHTNHGRQTVRCAAGVGDAAVFRGELVIVDTADDSEVFAFGRGGNHDFLRAGIQVRIEPGFAVGSPAGEKPGGFQSHVDAQIGPRQIARIAFRTDFDCVAVDHQVIAADFHVAAETPLRTVVFEQIAQSLCGTQIVDGHHFDIGRPVFAGLTSHDGPQSDPADAAEPVDSHSHRWT